MKTLFSLLALTICVSGLTLSTPALASHQDDYLPGPQTLSQSGIAPDKAQKIKAIREQNRQASEPLKAKVKEQRKALMDYMSSPSATQQQAQALSDQLQQTYNQMSTLRMKSWFEMRQYMTPEQMHKMVNARQERMADGRHKMMQNRHQKQQDHSPKDQIPKVQTSKTQTPKAQ